MGTIVNIAAILAGSLLGLLFHSRLPGKLRGIAFQGIGLVTVAIGVSLSLKSSNLMLAVVSIVAGGVLGETFNLEKGIERGAGKLKCRVGSHDNRFTEGVVTASLLFCVGSMSILGPLEEGMGQGSNLLYTKSIMDGVTSMFLASSLGVGVIFSILPVLAYQGGITLLASRLSQVMGGGMIADISCVGGILLIGLAINILEIRKISLVNMLPALLVIVPLSYFFG